MLFAPTIEGDSGREGRAGLNAGAGTGRHGDVMGGCRAGGSGRNWTRRRSRRGTGTSAWCTGSGSGYDGGRTVARRQGIGVDGMGESRTACHEGRGRILW